MFKLDSFDEICLEIRDSIYPVLLMLLDVMLIVSTDSKMLIIKKLCIVSFHFLLFMLFPYFCFICLQVQNIKVFCSL